MAALGVYVSLKPQLPEKHARFIVAFLLLFLGGGVVNVVQTRLASKAQEELRGQLTQIRKNTETPPQVTVNVPPNAPPQIIVNPSQSVSRHIAAGFIQFARMPEFLNNGQIAEGVPITTNLFLTNRGSEPVDDFVRVFATAIVSVQGKDPDQVDREVHSALSKQAIKNMKTAKKGPTINVNDVAWNTLSSPPLTKEQADGILRGTLRFYVYGWARWKDELHDFDSCIWLQAPSVPQVDSNKAVWHVCSN